MELKSFREILLKKADGNPYLHTLIKYAKDEIIADEVIDALQKMAEPSAAMGRGANHAVTSYAAGMKPVHVEQLRDALGHHISHYKAALKAHQAATDPGEKANLRNVADRHLSHVIPLMHLAGRASKHSGGQMVLDYPSTTPWETNYTTTERLPNGKLKEGTKDLGRRTMSPVHGQYREKTPADKNPRAVPNYRYLEMPPHPGHEMSSASPHKGGYPFEDIQLGNPMKRDAGQAYLPLEDIKDKKEFTPHPFDVHPVHAHADKAQHELGPEHHEAINAGLANWADNDMHKKWLADQKAKFAADPEAYKARGTKKSEHAYEGVKLGEMPHHKDQPASQQEVKETPKSSPAKEPAKKTSEGVEEQQRKIWNSMSPEHQKLYAHLFPESVRKK